MPPVVQLVNVYPARVGSVIDSVTVEPATQVWSAGASTPP